MSARVTYTSGGISESLAADFDQAVETVRAEIPKEVGHLIGGEFRFEGRELLERRNPARLDEVISLVHEANKETVVEAVDVARAAQDSWRSLDYSERCAIVRRAIPIIQSKRLQLSSIVTLETGKTRSESLGEVDEGPDLIEFSCSQMEDHGGFVVPLGKLADNEENVSVLKPHGVFAVIPSFNFPIVLGINTVAAALVAGNTVVLKPSDLTPWSGSLMAWILGEAGLPHGVLNVVCGGTSTGQCLLDQSVDAVAFTGSAEVGRRIARKMQEGPYPRPVIAEMGGKNPSIVTGKADLGKAAEGVARAAFGFSGQKCSACSRALVIDEVYDDFIDRLRLITEDLVVGDPSDADTYMGPLISEDAARRYDEVVAAASREGAVVAGGRKLDLRGHYVAPTVVRDVPAGHPLTREEVFLPFVTVVRVESLDDALEEANAVEYGLTAGIFSEDEEEIEAFLDKIEAGVVYVNRREGATTGAWPGAQSFGGWKASTLTGKGIGPYYVQQFMREQSQTIVR